MTSREANRQNLGIELPNGRHAGRKVGRPSTTSKMVSSAFRPLVLALLPFLACAHTLRLTAARRCPAPVAVTTQPTGGARQQQQQQQQQATSVAADGSPLAAASGATSLPPDLAMANGAARPAVERIVRLSDMDAQRRAELMEQSYEACRLITKQYAKTFYFGTKFFDEEKRRAVWAVYAWCRRTDDIVDKPRKEMGSLRTELSDWGERLEAVWRGTAHDLIDLALVDTIQKYPDLDIEPFEDMIKGMVMDLDQNRFETFEELYVYCYRVAGTVGLMMMPIMGTAPGYTAKQALEPALALGVALQLTNILRDVGEDRGRQRIYLPREDLERFGVSEAALLKGIKDEKCACLGADFAHPPAHPRPPRGAQRGRRTI